MPPNGAVCIHHGCTQRATTTRPTTDIWLYEDGIIIDADEWVCAVHATP